MDVPQVQTPSMHREALKELAFELDVSQSILDSASSAEQIKARKAALNRLKQAEALQGRWAKRKPDRIDLANAFTLFTRLVSDVDLSAEYFSAENLTSIGDSMVAIKDLSGKFYKAAKLVRELLNNYQPTVDWYAAPSPKESAYLSKVLNKPITPGWSIVRNTAKTKATAFGPLALHYPSFVESWTALASANQFSLTIPETETVEMFALVPTCIVRQGASATSVSQLTDLERRDLLQRFAAIYQAEASLKIKAGKSPWVPFESVMVRALAISSAEPQTGGAA